jgi:hypothetical protein
MAIKALFEGLVVDEFDQAVQVTYIGSEACYVVDDAGFRRHIPSEQVDRQVLDFMQQQVEGNEELLSEQAAQMLGQDDIFTRAMLINQFKNIDQQMEQLFQVGIPEEARAYLGMTGFRIRIDVHGEVLEINQPSLTDPDSE